VRSVTLEDLVAAARDEGWATGEIDVETIRAEAARLSWIEIPMRRGSGPVATLQPSTIESAHPSSLSSLYGLGRQPLHTDGAHLQQPPQFVVLASAAESATPTHVVKPRLGKLLADSDVSLSELEQGMFLVRNHAESFFAPAWSAGCYRYDPGCMSPCDQRANAVANLLGSLWDASTAIEWSTAGQVLVIDNHHTLHARFEVSDAELDRRLTRMAYQVAGV
jgi:hypothetical protein